MASLGDYDGRTCSLFDDNVHLQPVEVVVSAPRLPSWLVWLPGAQILNSINTTHWGLKVGDGYHDLKMRGLYRTKPDVVYAETLEDRDERLSSKSIFVGLTHFSNEEIRCIAKHMLRHSSWYHFWFDNCQSFIINFVGVRVICPTCTNEYGYAQSPQLIALTELADMRPFEFIYFLGFLASFLTRTCVSDELTKNSTLIASICSGAMSCLSHLAASQRARDRSEREQLEDPGRRLGEKLAEDTLRNMSVYDDSSTFHGSVLVDDPRETMSDPGLTGPDPVGDDWRSHQNDPLSDSDNEYDALPDSSKADDGSVQGYAGGVGVLVWLTQLLILPFALYHQGILTRYRIGTMSLAFPIVFFILEQAFLEVHSSFPFIRPARKGRIAVQGPCSFCQDIARTGFGKSVQCIYMQYGSLPSDLPVRQVFTPFWQRTWTTDDTKYLTLRISLCAMVLWRCRNLEPIDHFEVHGLVQFALNPFSPVTPWGHTVRQTIRWTFTLAFPVWSMVEPIRSLLSM